MRTHHLKAILAFIVSVGLAQPYPAVAQQPYNSQASISPTDGDSAPVFIEQANVNGRPAYLVMAAVEDKDIGKVTHGLIQQDPNNLSLIGKDANDPVIRAAYGNGQYGLVPSAYVLDDIKDMPLMKSQKVSGGVKSRLMARLKGLAQGVKENSLGFVCAIIYSGIVSSHVFVVSSSVGWGLSVFIPFMLFNCFVATQHHDWGHVIEGSAKAHRGFFDRVLGLFGKKLDKTSQNLVEATGRFNVTWLATLLSVSLLKSAAGDMEGVLDLLLTSFLFNYSVWDPTVLAKARAGLSKVWLGAYFCFQYLGGAFAELSVYSGISQTSWILAGVVLTGMLWTAAGDQVESAIANTIRSAKEKFKLAVNKLSRPFKRKGMSCADLLSGSRILPTFSTHSYAEDTW